MHKKILTIFLIIIFTIIGFNINNVLGNDVVSQAWKTDVDGRPYLLFRVYTTPHSDTVKKYHKNNSKDYVDGGILKYKYNNKSYSSKWVYTYTDDHKVISPKTSQFKTIAFGFHKEKLSTYTVSTKDEPNSRGYNYTPVPIDYNINTINKAYNESKAVYATITNNISDRAKYKDAMFYSILRNGGTYSTMDYGTNINVKNLYSQTPLEYRHAIVEIDGKNVYVTDNMIFGDDVEGFVTAAKRNGSASSCYVSQITVSKLYGNAKKYEVSVTAKDFYLQKDKNWSRAVKGKGDDKAMGSAVNLYDNKLEFPQLTNRTVLVRHINIGNNTTVSETIVNDATRINVSDLKDYLSLVASKNSDSRTLPASISTVNTTYSGKYEEYYENSIDVEEAITKLALPDATNKYKCIAYNVGVALDENSALDIVNNRIKEGQYTKGTEVYVPGKEATSDSDVVVIDFYYSEYDKDVDVNHIYVNKENGKVMGVDNQIIIPNDTAIMNGNSITRINNDYYIKETYSKKLGQSIIVTYAKSLEEKIKNGEVSYYGYEILDQKTNISSLAGKQINVDELNDETQATISNDSVQVNFYYYVENMVYVQEPDRNIGGELILNATGTNGACIDDDSLANANQTVTSIPTESKVKIGIVSNNKENSIISRFMVGAIKAEKVIVTGKPLSLKLNISMNGQNTTIDTSSQEYQTLKYNASYYKITEMALYRLKNLEVYDAEQDGGIFSWNSKKLKLKDKNITFELTGLLGKINERNVNDINNYVGVSITYPDWRTGKDKTTPESTTAAVLPIELLSEEEYSAVDADGKNGITDEDKVFASNHLQELANILESKKATEEELKTQQKDAIKAREQLARDYEDAQTILKGLKEDYDRLEAERIIHERAKNGAETDLDRLMSEKTTAEGKRDTFATVVTEKYDALQEANNKVTEVNANHDELWDDYDAKSKEAKRLETLVQCQDEVEDDRPLEEDEKTAIEQCKQYKEQYQDALKAAASAYKEYMNYLNKEYRPAHNAKIKAQNEYDSAVKARQDNEDKISQLNQDIWNQIQFVGVLQRAYDDFTATGGDYDCSKNNYFNYLNGGYQDAKKAYEDNKNNKVVENIEAQLAIATLEKEEAQRVYDEYSTYKNNLDANFDKYKAMYELYQEIPNLDMKTIAEKLGLKINMKVKNMMVSIYKDGKELSSLYTDDTSTPDYNYAETSIELDRYLSLDSEDELPNLQTNRPRIKTELYSGIPSTELKIDDYEKTDMISKNILNGVRNLSGKAEYEAEVVIGTRESAKGMEDTIYFSDQSNDEQTVTFILNQTKLSKTYKVNEEASTYEEKYNDVKPINIYTPITVSATLKSKEDKIVDQTEEAEANSSMIQVNTPFTITLDNGKTGSKYNKTYPYNSLSNTKIYRDGYYVKFDFDVHNVYINNTRYKKGERIPKGTWIGVITAPAGENEYATITAQAYGSIDDSIDIVSEENSSYTVRAFSYNASQIMIDKSISYTSIEKMIAENSGMDTLLYNICDTSSYFAEQTYEVTIINRLYEFRVTDVKDINWKNVFRKPSTSSTNTHSGVVYYSGTTKWNTKSDKTNDIANRTPSEIGKNPLRILPIGPYKNTDAGYIKAPKLGYRFSFDFKITGSYYTISDSHLVPNKEKTVEIATKFYYISKDGKDYYSEYNSTKEGIEGNYIYLFYKTANGKYVRIDENGGGYNLTFTPNDGYRYIEDNDISNLAKKSVSIGNLRNLKLTYEMATPTNNRAATTYYGEYKLPNSTIAVPVDKNGNYDINTQLKDGYIGVVFDITANNNGLKLKYSEQTNDEKANTSQWDYEGFLGYTNYGNSVGAGKPISLKLEKGSWKIDNKTYNEIKGSVILYDLDQRAATDYE